MSQFLFDEQRLIKAWLYVGHLLGFKMEQPLERAVLSPQEINHWMAVMAERSNVACRPFELKGEWWKSMMDPVIVFIGEAWAPCVVIPKGKKGAVLVDVETHSQTAINAVLAAKLQSVAYLFYNTLPASTRGAKDLLLLGLSSIKNHLGGIFAIIILLSTIRLFMPISNQIIFDYVIPSANTSLFWQLGFFLVLYTLTTFILNIVQSFSMLRYRTIMENKMQAAIWEKFLSLPSMVFQKFPRGDLIQRMMLIDNIRPFFMGSALYILLEAPFAVLYLVLMLSYSLKLGLIMTAILAVFFIIAASLRLYIQPLLAAQLQKSADLNAFLIQMISGIAKLRMAAAWERAFSRWTAIFSDYQSNALKLGMREIYFTLLTTLYPVLSIAVTYGMMVYYLQQDDASVMTMGQFIAFQSAFMMLSAAVGSWVGLTASYMEVMQIIRRSDKLLKEPLEQSGRKRYVEKLTGDLRVENLCFQYPETNAPVLTDVSFSCAPGEFIGIVGRSGSGKSTILRLLAGLEVPKSGRIFYDGHALESLDFTTLRRRMGVVLQSTTVFSGTVRDNICMGRHTTKEALQRALEITTFDQVLKEMPLGLDTYLAGGGNTISGGEQQRLLLARALLTEVDVLLLDEATSSLDSLTQGVIMRNLEAMRVSRIVVAHRLETVRGADRVIKLS